ncbi:MAG: hypothetical protein KME45_18280 [Stenomitos rutilans HA7619-LM2]|nr:hypothetical protein [Stenomitos rutilans HA7619-LM2]
MHPDIALGFWLGAFTFQGYYSKTTHKNECFWIEVCYTVQNTRVEPLLRDVSAEM